MRSIGSLDSDSAAVRFRDILLANGIDVQVEKEDEGGYSFWVIDEDHLPKASALLKQFRENPEAADFQNAQELAQRQRAEWAREQASKRSTVADSARIGYERNFSAFPYLTAALIIISVAVAIASQLGSQTGSVRFLFISDYFFDWETRAAYPLAMLRASDGWLSPEIIAAAKGFLPEVHQGQVWRLLTPIFLHFGLPHILFNSMWMKDLGTFIENRFGALYLLALVLVTGIASNFAQALWGSPNFGGLSGVIYGLFGFMWMRGKFDRYAGWSLNKNAVIWMIGWFLLCLFNSFRPSSYLPNVANTAHAAGLVVGMLWGFISAKR